MNSLAFLGYCIMAKNYFKEGDKIYVQFWNGHEHEFLLFKIANEETHS